MSNFLNKYKSVYDVFLDNWSYQSHFVLYLEALMRQQTLLPTYIKEMIFAYISGLNGCQYCKNIHAEISKKLLRDANDEQPLLDIENAGIEEKYKPILYLHSLCEPVSKLVCTFLLYQHFQYLEAGLLRSHLLGVSWIFRHEYFYNIGNH